MAITLTPAEPPRNAPSSKEIIEAFLESGLERASLDHDELERTLNGLYVALRAYIKKHDISDITVTMQDSHVILSRV